MNWNAVGAVAEIIGTILVVVTIFYLAVQTKWSARVSLGQTFQDHFNAINQHFNVMWSKENAELMIRGLKDFEQLPPAERGRFDNLVTNAFNLLESSYMFHKQGMLDDETLGNWSWYLRHHFLCYPGIRSWWHLKKDVYGPELQSWINEQICNVESEDFYGVYS